ncbi:histidine kinase [bacterium]|nr:MAG: histidine kinase [bacterium]
MKTWPVGLVIGKFYPPHRGHRFLIETALSRVEHLHIMVCGRPGEKPEGALRADWLREMFPQAKVWLINDIYYGHDDDSEMWAYLTTSWLGRAPDVVFTSEHYGQPFTQCLGCEHVEVDMARVQVPISGTRVRAAPLSNWEFLDAPLRQYYAKRVVIVGAESTGSTTLAQDLAERFNTMWVPEYGREYCENFWTGEDYVWQSREFTLIAAEQLRRENEAARACNGLLICDTDAFATRLWHRRYMGNFSPAVDAIAASHRPDLYLLTGDEIPFVQDGIRDGEAIRHEMHEHFVQELSAGDVPWHLLRGSREERLEAAVKLVEELLRSSKNPAT